MKMSVKFAHVYFTGRRMHSFHFPKRSATFQRIMNQWLGLNKTNQGVLGPVLQNGREGPNTVPKIAFDRWAYGQAQMVNIH